MKKQYNFRLDPSLVSQLDSFDGSRTFNLQNAIQLYVDGNNNGNTKHTQHLEEEILYLRSRVNNLLTVKIPLLNWIKQKLIESKLT